MENNGAKMHTEALKRKEKRHTLENGHSGKLVDNRLKKNAKTLDWCLHVFKTKQLEGLHRKALKKY